MTDSIIKKGDAQQYEAEPHHGDPDDGVTPIVRLIWMTPDPLGAVAFFNGIYSGKVYRSLDEVSDEARYQALVDVQKTHLQAPLEAIKLHFLIEGVDRSFTHQLVRQRTAVYAQESMRFAVLGDLIDATTLPPDLLGTQRSDNLAFAEHVSLAELRESREYDMASKEERMRAVWDWAIANVDAAYHMLVEGGMAAEEARGLLPHATATRINYITDLRNLKDHAGNRLCTQAQFHWRMVFNQIVTEIAKFGDGKPDDWQFKAIAGSNLFRPVCYQIGHCPFQASFDRACSIRDRVEANAKQGRPSEEWIKDWGTSALDGEVRLIIPGIGFNEWLLDPSAARV